MTQIMRDVTTPTGLIDVSEKVPMPTSNTFPNAAVVTPSDTVDLATPAHALYVGGTGNITLDTIGGQSTVLISAIPVGTILPIAAKRVRSTGTTATLIVALS